MPDPSIQRIESLRAYLEAQGLEVVSSSWDKGQPFPVLLVRPKAKPKANTDAEKGVGDGEA